MNFEVLRLQIDRAPRDGSKLQDDPKCEWVQVLKVVWTSAARKSVRGPLEEQYVSQRAEMKAKLPSPLLSPTYLLVPCSW